MPCLFWSSSTIYNNSLPLRAYDCLVGIDVVNETSLQLSTVDSHQLSVFFRSDGHNLVMQLCDSDCDDRMTYLH